jgi:putative SOS response-associated peptidase YedK
MCNRYALKHSKRQVRDAFQAGGNLDDYARYNIEPTQPVLIVGKEHGKKVGQFRTMRWGLIPSWAKDVSIDSFYEWRKMGTVKSALLFSKSETGMSSLWLDCGTSG